MKIPLELTVVPRQSTTQAKYTLTAMGSVVFDDYEEYLTTAQKAVVKSILTATSKSFGSIAEGVRA